MGLSIGRMGATSTSSYMAVRPQQYALSNESQASDVYEASAVKGMTGLGTVHPVQYPNAQVSGQSSTSSVAAAHGVEEAYNEIASAFTGMATSYGADIIGTSYGMIGSQIDVYA